MTFEPVRFGHRKKFSLRVVVAVLLFAGCFAGGVRAESYLPAMGGGGGGQFKAPCPDGQNLNGFELRAGDDVDAIRPACVISYGPIAATAPALTTDSGLVAGPGTLGGLFQQVAPGWYGGPGGGIQRVLCPTTTPIVTGMYVQTDGDEDKTINNIHLFCGRAVIEQTPAGNPSAIFDAPYRYPKTPTFLQESGSQRCPGGQVAVGVHGRAGKYLDAIGLICDAPRIAPPSPGSVKAMGRVRLDGAPAGPSISICESARQARARNSPAAPGLEAQCRAQEAQEAAKVGASLNALAARGEAIARQDPVAAELRNLQPDGPSRRGFNVGLAAAEGHTAPGPGKQKIHDQLSPAEQAGFDAAVSFSLTRNTKRIADLAAKGEGIANQDPLALELRNQQPNGPARRGFDVGMAAAEGQTSDGPGKRLILGGLDPAEQGGFATAVSFSVDRNRNADSAAKGAAIAEADPDVAAVRAGEADALYWLGFDIATGIFGDPALGARGNTATGPGSNKIRNDLSYSARRGFDASVAFHLSRKYTP
jgi:hypothetical protein